MLPILTVGNLNNIIRKNFDSAPEKRGDTPQVDNIGFTLMEMIIVMLLLSIFLVLNVPSLRQTVFNDPLRTDTRKFIGLINDIRQEAKNKQTALIIYLDLDDGRVWYGADTDAVTESEVDVKLTFDADVALRNVICNSSEAVDRGLAELWVSNRGYMDKCVLHLDNNADDQLSLVLDTFVPEVRIYDGYIELE